MPKPRRVVLDESSLESPEQAHALLARQLSFPDYYGANLDALADCLGDVHKPTRIVLRRDPHADKPWFDAIIRVVRACAERSCFVGCSVREEG